MILTTLDWVIIVGFLALTFVVGLLFTQKAGKNIQSFFLGGRNLSWWVAGTSMVATTFAADTPLAVTELVAKNGIAGNWLWWNALAGGMLTTFFFAKYWRRANIMTEVELIELRYSGKEAKFLRGFKALYLGLFMNCLIIAWVNVALTTLLIVFFDLSTSQALIYVGIAMFIVMIYSSLSGLLGVAITDVIQFVIAMAGCIILAFLVVNSDKIGGIEGLKTKLPSWSLDFFPKISAQEGIGGETLALTIGSFFAFMGMQWWASWYPGAEPGGGGYIAQRIMSTKNERHGLIATLFFQVAHYCIRPWPWILVGLCAIILYPQLGVDDKKLGYVLAMKEFLPSGLRGLLLVAFLAAYMSTISTQLNWGASYVVNDFYKRFIAPTASTKNLILVSRLATLFIMLIALAVTPLITSISGVWQFIIECGAGLGLVLILRWYWWRINAWTEITATIAPFIGYALARWGLMWVFPNSFFFTVAFTTIAWIIVMYTTKSTKLETLKSFYTLIRPEGAWEPIRKALGIKITSNLPMLIICWLSSTVWVYAILFLIGKSIFREWQEAGFWGIICLIAGSILFYTSKKIKIFE